MHFGRRTKKVGKWTNFYIYKTDRRNVSVDSILSMYVSKAFEDLFHHISTCM